MAVHGPTPECERQREAPPKKPCDAEGWQPSSGGGKRTQAHRGNKRQRPVGKRCGRLVFEKALVDASFGSLGAPATDHRQRKRSGLRSCQLHSQKIFCDCQLPVRHNKVRLRVESGFQKKPRPTSIREAKRCGQTPPTVGSRQLP